MKWLMLAIAVTVGAFCGATVFYLLMAPTYCFYAWLNPVDPSSECARGGGIAWLSILTGAILGGGWAFGRIAEYFNEPTLPEAFVGERREVGKPGQ